jgi:hypothetical protein
MDPLLATDGDSASSSRWQLIRDLAVFQLKLGLDALRDLVLSPISLIAGIVDLFASGEQAGKHFYSVLVAGRRTEAWINLFGELDRVAPRGEAADGAERASVDAIVERMERLLVEQYERGGVTASAKIAIDRGLDALARRGPR